MKINCKSDNSAWNSTRSSCPLNVLNSMNQRVDKMELLVICQECCSKWKRP